MAGNERSGRQAVPISEKVERGYYQPGRHGPLPDAAEGEPVMPKSLTGDARKFWIAEVPGLVERGCAKLADSPALVLLCEVWALLQKAVKAAKKQEPGGPAWRAANTYLTQFETLSRRFGLTHGDRQKLRVLPKEKPDDGVASRQRSG